MIPPSPRGPTGRVSSPLSPDFRSRTHHRRTSSQVHATSRPQTPQRHAPSSKASFTSSMVLVSPSEWVPDWFPPADRTPPSPPPVKAFSPRRSYLQPVASPAGVSSKDERKTPAFRTRGLDLAAVGGGTFAKGLDWVGTWAWFLGEGAVWLYFDFTTTYILILLSIARPRPWALSPAIYLAVFVAWIILAIHHLKTWWAAWNQKSPPIAQIYLNPYSHLLTSLISPSHRAFLHHIRQSTLSRSDRITATCNRIVQTYVSTLLILPRAALALMLVLGGTNLAFVGIDVDEGLYFTDEDSSLTIYAVVVLLASLGATAVRVGVLLGAWAWMRRVEGPRRKVLMRKGESAGYEVGGWRGRLDERIREISESCLTGPWPDHDSYTRRAGSNRPVSQLGRTPSTQPLTSAPGTPTWLKNQRMGNLQQTYLESGPIPGAVDLSRAQYGSTDRQPARTGTASFTVARGYKPPSHSPPSRDPSAEPVPATSIVATDIHPAQTPRRQPAYPFPPSPQASPTVAFSPTAPGPASPFDEDGPPLSPTAPPPPISFSRPGGASVSKLSFLSPSPEPSRSSSSASADERARRMSSRTFGRQSPDDDPASSLPAPPTRGKWSNASTAARTGEDSDAASRSSAESHGRVREVVGRAVVTRSTSKVLFKAGRRAEREGSQVDRHPRASTEPKKERHRPSSLLVPESERTGRRSITLET